MLYSRQDRKDKPHVPISARVVARAISPGLNRIITMDLHAAQIQGFYPASTPVDNLYSFPEVGNHLNKKNSLGDLENLSVVSPDVGGIKMARAYAKKLGVPLAIVDKRRVSTEETEVMNILGEIEGRDVCIVDDIVATAGSLVEAVEALKGKGAKDVYAAISHPVLSGPAIDRLQNSSISKLFVADTIPLSEDKLIDKIEVLSVAPLLGEAIKRIHKEASISVLFD